jgi:3-hydroxyisobutyrate dehydrogenase
MEPPMTAIPGPPSPVRPGGTRIGWIGVGVMGRSIVGRLLDAGFTVTLFSRRQESAEPLLARGAAWAGSPAAVAAVSDLVVTMVGYPEDVRQVVLGDDGVLAGVAQGGLLVDHTTSAPQLAVEIATAAAARGVWSLDAPVSGGDRGAREGTLTVMVGGDAGPRDALAAYWQVIARTVVPCGGPGAGQQTKLVNQIAIASGMIGMCEALVYAGKAGLDLPTTLAAIQPGDFAPGFMVDHILKDMRLAIDECRRMRLDLPGLALAESLYAALAARGGGRLGTQALVQVLGDLPVDGRASG